MAFRDAGENQDPPREGAFLQELRSGKITTESFDAKCKSSSAAEIVQGLGSLSSLSKQLAATCLGRQTGGGRALLGLITDGDAMVRTRAAEALSHVSDPSVADDLLYAVPQTLDEHVRGRLYLALGQSLDTARIEELRALARNEKRPAMPWSGGNPSSSALIALLKLGGKPERAAFVNEIRSAQNQDEIRWIADVLVQYLRDPSLARPLGAWLENQAWADTSHTPTFRVCDLAAWTAQDLGIKLPIDPTRIRRYDPATLARVGAVLEALPGGG